MVHARSGHCLHRRGRDLDLTADLLCKLTLQLSIQSSLLDLQRLLVNVECLLLSGGWLSRGDQVANLVLQVGILDLSLCSSLTRCNPRIERRFEDATFLTQASVQVS